MRHSPPTSFTFLFVCTGNICRSPYAELLTAHLLSERLGEEARGFRLGSAGVKAVVGSEIHPHTRTELAPWGLAEAHADGFCARQLAAGMVDSADVILTATVEHRVAVLKLCPAALPRTFTLLEFARLISHIDPGSLPVEPVARAHAMVHAVPALRAEHRPPGPNADSIADPMGRRRRAHRMAARQIEVAAKVIAEAIAL